MLILNTNRFLSIYRKEVLQMKKKKHNRPTKDTAPFATLPIVQPDGRLPDSKTPLPDEQNVIDAKEWVDYNAK